MLTIPRNEARMDRLDAAVFGYLALPNLIFLLSWPKPQYGWPAGLLLLAGLWLLLRHVTWPTTQTAGQQLFARRAVLIACCVAVPWVLLSGLGHFVYANRDWNVRGAVLSDLVQNSWPVLYPSDMGVQMLRTTLGFFLPAAVIGKLTSLHGADLSLAAWGLLGVLLSFLMIARDSRTLRAVFVRLMVFVLFSGMDILGEAMNGNLPGLGSHIEWWAMDFQYSSHTTQLFWVPNHALPGWLGALWLLRFARGTLPVSAAIILVALTPLWSPFAAVGLVPLFGVAILLDYPAASAAHLSYWQRVRQHGQHILRALLHPATLLVLAACALLIYPFLLLTASSIHSGAAFERETSALLFFWRYISFVLMEFLMLCALMLRRFPRDALLWTVIVCLLLLPFYNFGPYSDLTMRASIPSLCVVAWRLGQWLSEFRLVSGEPAPGAVPTLPPHALVLLLFVLGTVTPIDEIARAIQLRAWPLNPHINTIEATRGAPHYIIPRDQPWANRFLR